MSTPADKPYLLEEWSQLEEKLREEGMPKTKAWEKIGERYDLPYSTVRYWLDKNQRGRDRSGRYQREQLQRREYDLAYKRLIRNLPYIISEALENQETVGLEELSQRLAKAAKENPQVKRKIKMKPKTLEKKIDQMEEEILHQIGPETFRYKKER